MDRRTYTGTASKPAPQTRYCSAVESEERRLYSHILSSLTTLVKILCGAPSLEALLDCRRHSKWQSTTNQLGMNAFFTALDCFKLHTKC